MNAGEYLRLSAQGEGATLTCLLRVLGSRIAQVSSLGGTGGTATLAAYFEEAAKVELEIRRTEKSAAPAAIRAEIAAQRQMALVGEAAHSVVDFSPLRTCQAFSRG